MQPAHVYLGDLIIGRAVVHGPGQTSGVARLGVMNNKEVLHEDRLRVRGRVYWGIRRTSMNADDIAAARDRIGGQIMRTPLVSSQTLSAITGADLHLEFENLQFTASFKERGALNCLLCLSGAERRRGVIAMSAGNHARRWRIMRPGSAFRHGS